MTGGPSSRAARQSGAAGPVTQQLHRTDGSSAAGGSSAGVADAAAASLGALHLLATLPSLGGHWLSATPVLHVLVAMAGQGQNKWVERAEVYHV